MNNENKMPTSLKVMIATVTLFIGVLAFGPPLQDPEIKKARIESNKRYYAKVKAQKSEFLKKYGSTNAFVCVQGFLNNTYIDWNDRIRNKLVLGAEGSPTRCTKDSKSYSFDGIPLDADTVKITVN